MLTNISNPAAVDAMPPISPQPVSAIILRLYVTGRTPSAALAIAAVTDLQRDIGKDQLVLEVIDVLDDPISALNDDVYATPTVIRVKPGPLRRLFGNIASTEMLVAGLQLSHPAIDG